VPSSYLSSVVTQEVQKDNVLLPGSRGKQAQGLAVRDPSSPPVVSQEVQEDSVLLPGSGVSPVLPLLSAAAGGGKENLHKALVTKNYCKISYFNTD